MPEQCYFKVIIHTGAQKHINSHALSQESVWSLQCGDLMCEVLSCVFLGGGGSMRSHLHPPFFPYRSSLIRQLLIYPCCLQGWTLAASILFPRCWTGWSLNTTPWVPARLLVLCVVPFLSPQPVRPAEYLVSISMLTLGRFSLTLIKKLTLEIVEIPLQVQT